MAFHVTQCPGCDSTFNTSAKVLQLAAGKVRCGACLHVFEATENFVHQDDADNDDQYEESVFIGNNPQDYFDPSDFLTRGALTAEANEERLSMMNQLTAPESEEPEETEETEIDFQQDQGTAGDDSNLIDSPEDPMFTAESASRQQAAVAEDSAGATFDHSEKLDHSNTATETTYLGSWQQSPQLPGMPPKEPLAPEDLRLELSFTLEHEPPPATATPSSSTELNPEPDAENEIAEDSDIDTDLKDSPVAAESLAEENLQPSNAATVVAEESELEFFEAVAAGTELGNFDNDKDLAVFDLELETEAEAEITKSEAPAVTDQSVATGIEQAEIEESIIAVSPTEDSPPDTSNEELSHETDTESFSAAEADSYTDASDTESAPKTENKNEQSDAEPVPADSIEAEDSSASIRRRALNTVLKDEDALEAIPKENLAALDGMSTPLELVAKKESRWLRSSFLGLGIVLLGVALVIQFLWRNMDSYNQVAQVRPLYEFGCQWLNCELPVYSDIASIRSDNLSVRSDPVLANGLQVNIVFRNTAEFPQPFPVMILSFNSVDNEVVALREFAPDEYLAAGLRSIALMPVMAPVQISLNLIDPGPDAVNYTLAFRNP